MTVASAVDLISLPRGRTGEVWVYLHHAEDGRVLYVGCTGNPRGRNGQHARTSAWWPQVAHVAVAGPFTDRESALDHEALLIREHQPVNNVLHTDRAVHVYHPRKPAPSVVQAEEEVRRARLALRRAEHALRLARQVAS